MRPQAARGLGKSLRAFAPTLQELTSVSRDLKNTLDEELGIDEIRREFASARVRAVGFGLNIAVLVMCMYCSSFLADAIPDPLSIKVCNRGLAVPRETNMSACGV